MRLRQLKGGQSLSVSVGKMKQEKSEEVDAEVAAKLKKGLDLSERETVKMLSILRAGNVKVEKNVMGILKEIGSTLEEEYEDVKMEFEVNKKDDDDEESGKKRRLRRKVRRRVLKLKKLM